MDRGRKANKELQAAALAGGANPPNAAAREEVLASLQAQLQVSPLASLEARLQLLDSSLSPLFRYYLRSAPCVSSGNGCRGFLHGTGGRGGRDLQGGPVRDKAIASLQAQV